ncbi:DUF736 domain-containing protein [Plastoroseomonas hellenica]|uniref:DUF736 domain-containing protein n=1 Tax=Plastoroseomonas hellenica TaxID=2687306 RepID=UPI0038D20549
MNDCQRDHRHLHQDHGGYTGTVSTLALDAKVQVRPAEKSSEKAPDFRILAGRAEIGAAWKTTANDGRD